MGNFLDWLFGNKAKEEQRKQEDAQLLQSMDQILGTPQSPTRTLQEALWKASAFKGVKDRHGKDVTYKSAVDGLMGRMTRTAIANAKKAGYNVNINTGVVNMTGPERPQIQGTSYKGSGTGTKFGEKKPQKKGGLAAMREMTHAARTGGMNSTPIKYERSEDAEKLAYNVVQNPIVAGSDLLLFLADKAGAPSNATNYLRDLNVQIPYRMKAAISAIFPTMYNGKSFNENYQEQLSNPNFITKLGTILPLNNDISNFSTEELKALKEMAGTKGYITNSDIKRVSENGKYGAGTWRIYGPDQPITSIDANTGRFKNVLNSLTPLATTGSLARFLHNQNNNK